MKLPRRVVLQTMLDRFEKPHYLEVGVERGLTFHALNAARKVAVDPVFQFDKEQAKRDQPHAEYCETTSDQFFSECKIEEKFDVIYLDGLDTFEQTLRVLMNSLSHIKDNSIIIVDDIFPSSLAAAMPSYREFKIVYRHMKPDQGGWMGDVYKLVMFVEAFMPAWEYSCTEEGHGQLVMWHAPRATTRERLITEIGTAGFDRAIIERAAFKFAPFEQILAEMGSPRPA